ncbi:MAG: DUF5787 family protein [Halobacteriaceae archaeon]
MREYGFELRLCATLERRRRGVIARQLGGAVLDPGTRVVDVVHVAPGPAFEDRTGLTPEPIPRPVIDADLGVARWRPVTKAIPGEPERARAAAERGAELGVLERARRDGRSVVRRAAPYPKDWFGAVTAIENKPDLATPGDLGRQLRTDVALGLFDRVVLATASHVTGAHLNRIPEPVGVWEFDPEERSVAVIREPTALEPGAAGVEIRAEHPGRTDIATVDAAAKARARRQIAERAYGKGWRPDRYPACANAVATDAGVPECRYYDRVVDPATDCGRSCPAREAASPPSVDVAELRAARTDWEPEPEPVARRQADLTGFRSDPE